MNEYYYSDGHNQFGPYKTEELKGRKISKDTLVWCEGMTEWKKALDVEELNFLFASIPPPIIKTNTPPPIINAVESKQPPVKYRKGTDGEVLTQKMNRPNKRKRNILIILISVLVIATLIVLYLKLFNSSSSNSQEKEVESVAVKFLDHLKNKEYAEAKRMATKESESWIDMMSTLGPDNDKKTGNVEDLDCKIDGDKSTCTYKQNEKEETLNLIKKDNQWIVDMRKENPSGNGINNENN